MTTVPSKELLQGYFLVYYLEEQSLLPPLSLSLEQLCNLFPVLYPAWPDPCSEPGRLSGTPARLSCLHLQLPLWASWLQPCPLTLSPPLFRTEHAEFRGCSGLTSFCGSVFISGRPGACRPTSASLPAGNRPAREDQCVASVVASTVILKSTWLSREESVFPELPSQPKVRAVEIAAPSLSHPPNLT